jgi:hypothetical protein
MLEPRNAYRILVMIPSRKCLLGTPKGRWKDYIKMNLWGTRYEDQMWMELAQECVQWLVFILAALNLWVMLPQFQFKKLFNTAQANHHKSTC